MINDINSKKKKHNKMKLTRIVLFAALNAGIFGEEECKYTPLGVDYQGKQNTTASGIPCQKWDVNVPHTPCSKCSGPENYCRNPTEDHGGPWCYTMNPMITMEFCNIPDCNVTVSDTCRYTKHGTEYQGKKNTTACGTPCQRYDVTSPHVPLFIGPENYCRNDDYSPLGHGVIRRTLQYGGQYCDIPYCGHNTIIRKTCRKANKNYNGPVFDDGPADSYVLCASRCLSTQGCYAAVFQRNQSRCLLKQSSLNGTLYSDNFDTFLFPCDWNQC